jgi:hypothetical protein
MMMAPPFLDLRTRMFTPSQLPLDDPHPTTTIASSLCCFEGRARRTFWIDLEISFVKILLDLEKNCCYWGWRTPRCNRILEDSHHFLLLLLNCMNSTHFVHFR